MNQENYYERHKELLELREEVLGLRKQEKLNNLYCKLKTLHNMKNELLNDLQSISENCDYINRTIGNVEPLLHSNQKISMSQECAVNFKCIVEMILALTDYEDCSKNLKEDNLSFNTQKLIETLMESVDSDRTNLHYNINLMSHIKKILNREKQIIETDQQVSPKELDDSGHTVTFSEAIASSPLNKS